MDKQFIKTIFLFINIKKIVTSSVDPVNTLIIWDLYGNKIKVI